MSWRFILENAMHYGPSIIILVLLAFGTRPILKWTKGIEDRLKVKDKRITANEKNIENFHNTCHIPKGAVSELKKDVKALQDNEHKIDMHIIELNAKLSNVETMTTAIYGHYFEKGINRRASDKDGK